MDATCKVQDNIHVFRLIHNMCPGFWVHINGTSRFMALLIYKMKLRKNTNGNKNSFCFFTYVIISAYAITKGAVKRKSTFYNSFSSFISLFYSTSTASGRPASSSPRYSTPFTCPS